MERRIETVEDRRGGSTVDDYRSFLCSNLTPYVEGEERLNDKIGEKERFPPENCEFDRFETRRRRRRRIGNRNEVTTGDIPFPNSGSHKCAGNP